jgi:phosphoribosylglycinamide formyltransferase
LLAHAARRRAVFVSGGGSNFKAVHAATVDGRINGRVVVRAAALPNRGRT